MYVSLFVAMAHGCGFNPAASRIVFLCASDECMLMLHTMCKINYWQYLCYSSGCSVYLFNYLIPNCSNNMLSTLAHDPVICIALMLNQVVEDRLIYIY